MAKRVLVKDLESDLLIAHDELYTKDGIIECQREEYIELGIENTSLIKKNEALEAVLDTIAMATAAGQMVVDL
jgi:hypothetical protein